MLISGKIIGATIFGVIIIAFGLWNVYSRAIEKTDSKTIEELQTEEVSVEIESRKDSDGDGIKDWEEKIIGTDPNKKDTDGNGTSDADDVAKVRALLTGEYAKAISPVSDEANQLSGAKPRTSTDSLARELIGAYIEAKQFGKYDPALFEDIVRAAASAQFKIEKTRLTEKDILVASDGINSIPQNYVKSVFEILKPLENVGEYELTTFANAVKNKSPEDFTKLRAAALAYEKVANVLKTLKVPTDALQTQLVLVNSMMSMHSALTLMAESETDPVKAFTAIKTFLEAEDSVKVAYSNLSIYKIMHEQKDGVKI